MFLLIDQNSILRSKRGTRSTIIERVIVHIEILGEISENLPVLFDSQNFSNDHKKSSVPLPGPSFLESKLFAPSYQAADLITLKFHFLFVPAIEINTFLIEKFYVTHNHYSLK